MSTTAPEATEATNTQADASVESAAEGSFGAKPSTAQVDLLDSVTAQLRKGGKMSEKQKSEVRSQKSEKTETATTDPAGSDSPPEPKQEAKPEDTEAKKPGWQKRIDKLTFEKKESEEALKAAQEKATELEARLAELESNPPEAKPEAETATATQPDSLLALDSLDAVEAHRSRLEDLRDVLDDYKATGWEGTNAQGEPLEYTPEQIKAQLASVRAELRALPGVEKALRQRDETYRPQLAERYDWWSDARDPRRIEVNSLLKQFPELRRAPNHELILANHVAMEAQLKQKPASESRKAEAKAKAPSVPADDPPPVPDTATAAPATHRSQRSPQMSGQVLSGVQSGDRGALASFVQSFLKAGSQ